MADTGESKESSEARRTSLREIASSLMALGGLILFVLWLLRPILTGRGLPWGTDVHGHLARVWYMASELLRTGSIPDWFPGWYSGTPLLQYYPPLATLLMVPIQLLTADTTLTYRIFVSAAMIFASGLTYWVARRWLARPWSALAGALYVAAPYTMFTVFDEGNLPRVLSLVAMPLALGSTLSLVERGDRGSFLGLALAAAFLVLSHHQQAAVVLIALGVVAMAYLGQDRERNLRIVAAGAAILLGILLCSAWLVPALTHADYPTVPDLSLYGERQPLYSVGWNVLDPTARARSIEVVYVGLSLVVLGIASTGVSPSRRQLALLAGAVVSIALAFGVNNPLFSLLPLRSTLLPERFVNIATLLLALLVTGLGAAVGRRWPGWRFAAPAAWLGIAALAALDFASYWSLPRLADYPTVQQALSELRLENDAARLDVRSTEGSIWSLLPLTDRGASLAFGWSIETTPHLPTFSQFNLALRSGSPEFVRRTYELWNVESAVIPEAEADLVRALEEGGFARAAGVGGNVVLNRGGRPSLVQRMTSNSLAIGRGAYTAATVFPWMSFGTSWNVEDYPEDYLALFDLVYLFDFRYDDTATLEARIAGWVRDGKTVVIDLTGIPETRVFGVGAYSIEVPLEPEFAAGPAMDFAAEAVYAEPFEYEGAPWRGVAYSGLDGVILEVLDAGGVAVPVLGYREIPEGRVYFMGLNWMTHVLLTGDETAASWIDRFFDRANPSRSPERVDLPVALLGQPADDWGFAYRSGEDTPVVVSQTWSRHWEARLDGAPVDVRNHENMILMSLPAGQHVIELIYGSTPVQAVGWAITGIALVALSITSRGRNRITGLRAQTRTTKGVLRSSLDQ